MNISPDGLGSNNVLSTETQLIKADIIINTTTKCILMTTPSLVFSLNFIHNLIKKPIAFVCRSKLPMYRVNSKRDKRDNCH